MEKILVYGMTDNPGGIESYLISLLPSFKNKIKLDFVTDFDNIAYKELLENYGACIHYIPAKSKGLFAHLKAFKRILKDNPQYKTIYFNILDAGAAITQLVPFFMKRKIVTHSHNGNTDKPKLHKICKPLLKITSGSKIACSQLAAKFMFGNTKKVTIIKNCVDAQKFRYSFDNSAKAKIDLHLEGKKVICHIGRLTYQKNPIALMDIFKEFLSICPEAVLLSVGTGDMEEKTHSYAKEIGIYENVKFLGIQDNIAQILAASDVFFLPSLYEGLPIVAIEAQAAGLPLVLSDNITTETDITGNIAFISLKESYIKWAEALLKASLMQKKDTFFDIQEAGYDISCSAENISKLEKILLGVQFKEIE